MAEPIDYLKTYLNMNPEDYSRMQAQIGGETLPEREIFNLQAPVMPKPMPMPAPRQAIAPMPMPVRPRSMLDIQQRFAPQRFAGGGLSKALSDLKTRIS